VSADPASKQCLRRNWAVTRREQKLDESPLHCGDEGAEEPNSWKVAPITITSLFGVNESTG
jgi:hypothetical protein